jgi:hypothetical protein
VRRGHRRSRRPAREFPGKRQTTVLTRSTNPLSQGCGTGLKPSQGLIRPCPPRA